MSVSIIQDCDPCNQTTPSQVPGPAGPAGSNGSNGSNGVNAFTTVSAAFTQPAVGSSVTVYVVNSAWMFVGQNVQVANTGGFYQVSSVNSATSVNLVNLGYTGNATAGTIISSNSQVSPGGVAGPTGPSGANNLNGLSPTTTKGDLMVDNGINSPNASVTRLGVGTNGQVLIAASTVASGVTWGTIIPSAATLNGIPIFSTATGSPIALSDSGLTINGGAVQTSGGNARGAQATDLQLKRGNPAQVASGANSVIPGGESNTANATDSVVSGGIGNTASAAGATVGGGNSNTASAIGATVPGGYGNNASGQCAFGVGQNNTVSGNYSIAHGFSNNAGGVYSHAAGFQSNTDKLAQRAFSAGMFAAAGDAQVTELVVRALTTNATAAVMSLDGTGSTNLPTIPINTAWAVSGVMIVRSGAGASALNAVYTINAGLKNNNGTTSLIGSATVTQTLADGSFPSVTVAVSADNTHDALQVLVTGVAATTIHWVCYLRLIEVAA